ncbi:hypothetical protein HYR54_15870 [Candidatus Acetothermia bacterium]|nr:hypothetical protein [Candidatus Acetothermia bacterium]
MEGKPDSHLRIFDFLYHASDGDGVFFLNASLIASTLNYSRKTIYQALDFFKKVNLVKLIAKRTGRGQHSKYQLTWMKPKKCHPKQQVVNKDLHSSSDVPSAENKLDGQRWKKAMRAFRLLVEESRLEKPQKRVFVQMVGTHLKGKTAEYAKRLYEELKSYVSKIRVKKWVKTLKDLAKWGMGLLRFLMGHKFQSTAGLKQREASERDFEARWNHELEKSERELEKWLAYIKTAPIAERLQAVEDGMEAWVAICTDLDRIGPSEEEKAFKRVCLCHEYGLKEFTRDSHRLVFSTCM